MSAACLRINLPTLEEPVIEIFLTMSEAINCCAILGGSPDSKLITPGGTPHSLHISTSSITTPGVVNLLSGDPPSIAQQLIASDIVKKISITGSSRVGKLILKQAADKVQRVTMELSGHSPFIVFKDADIKKATDIAIAAKFRNNGQVCICLLYTSPSPRDLSTSRMPSSA